MEIRSLGNTSFDELFEAFERAFADYEMQLDKAEHVAMLKRRGFDPKLSFAAFDGDKIVSFTCNGIGDFHGIPMAYDTGTGTLKDYRGRGLATRIFEYSIPYLREAGIKEYLLEVLQHNTGAVSVYRKLGFEVTREFYYFRREWADQPRGEGYRFPRIHCSRSILTSMKRYPAFGISSLRGKIALTLLIGHPKISSVWVFSRKAGLSVTGSLNRCPGMLPR